ncbi:MAG: sugar phosphate nucleotidyltransferase [Candidatus Bathyarchaeota archaeon]|nr:sugar phosphate nucleotidyltransferase [Candidatus Bathyarchaeota archaeon]
MLLHGGYGTDLKSLAHTGPKQLIPVANKPISENMLEGLRISGITEIAVLLGNVQPEKVKEHYGDYHGCDVTNSRHFRNFFRK